MISFIDGLKAYLCHNLSKYRKEFIFDATTLFVCAALFFANTHLLKPALLSASPTIANSYGTFLATCYLNDLLGGLSFMSYTNLLFDITKPELRAKRIITCILYILACGIFWELASPLFRLDSVADPYDLVAYTFGAAIYWSLNKTATLCQSDQT